MSTHGWDDDHDFSSPGDSGEAYFESLRQQEAKKLEEQKIRTDPYYAISVYKSKRDKLMEEKGKIDGQLASLSQQQQTLTCQIDELNQLMRTKMKTINGELTESCPPPRYSPLENES
jgi:hypothetical protein